MAIQTATTLNALNLQALTRLSQQELDGIFRDSRPGSVPQGDMRGTVILKPGTFVGSCARILARALLWKGKVFNPATQELLNKLTPFSIRAIRARVYVADSWLDSRPAIVLDYSQTSFVARKIRDEIREVAPGLYLGKVWWGKRRLLDFALQR